MRTCEQGRTSLVRVFAENPGITPGSGFQPPHSRLQRKKDNRGLRPWGTLYFLAAKSTKNSPADAFAYFVPANVRNGRLFAGLQANRPRFLPLLAGPSFHGSGIGPGSFAAIPSFRPGKEANTRTCEQGRTSLVRLFAENPGIAPGSGFKPPHSRLQRRKNNRQPACPEREAA